MVCLICRKINNELVAKFEMKKGFVAIEFSMAKILEISHCTGSMVNISALSYKKQPVAKRHHKVSGSPALLLDVVKSQSVAGQRPRQGTKSCRMGRNSVRPSVHPSIHPFAIQGL